MDGWYKTTRFFVLLQFKCRFCVAKPLRQTDDPALLVEPPPRAGVFFCPRVFFQQSFYLCAWQRKLGDPNGTQPIRIFFKN